MSNDNQRVATPSKSVDLDSIMVGIEEYLNEIDSNEGEEIKVNIVKDEDEHPVPAEKSVANENKTEIELGREKAVREEDDSASAKAETMPAGSEDASVEDEPKKTGDSEADLREGKNEGESIENKDNTEAEKELTKSAEEVTGDETEADVTGKLAASISEPGSGKVHARDASEKEPKEQQAEEEKRVSEGDGKLGTEQMEKPDPPNTTALNQENVAKDSDSKPEDIVEDEADEYKAELNASLENQQVLKSQMPKSVSKISVDARKKIPTESMDANDVGGRDDDDAGYKSDSIDQPTTRETDQPPNKNAVCSAQDTAPITDANGAQTESNAAKQDEEEHVEAQEPNPEIIEQKGETGNDIEAKNPVVEPRTVLDQETEELLRQLEMMEASTANADPRMSDSHSTTKAEIRAFNERQPIYIYTSLAGGGFHMIPRTNRLATILTANRIAFEYRDLGTDAEARSVWKSFAGGRSLPGVVRGRDDVIGNWEKVEEANENYALRELLYDSL